MEGEKFNFPDPEREGEVLFTKNLPEGVINHVLDSYGDISSEEDILRSHIFHFPEFRSLKQDELSLAVEIFIYIVELICRPDEDNPELSEQVSQDELAEVFYQRKPSLFDRQTVSFVAGQVISAMKRIIAEQSKPS